MNRDNPNHHSTSLGMNDFSIVQDKYLTEDEPKITQSELKKIFIYDPDTGIFTRKITTSPNAIAGDVVGTERKDGYLQVSINKKFYLLHRLAWLYINGYFPEEIDHDNRIKDDNRACNLVESTRLQNSKNRSLSSNNTSGHHGVREQDGRFVAKIDNNGKSEHIGSYDTYDDAVEARKKKEVEYCYHKNHGK